MKFFRYKPDSEKFGYIYAPPHARDSLDLFESTPKLKEWTEITVEPDERGLALGDFPSLYNSTPVFSEKAWKTLMPHLGDSIEALPINHPGRIRLFAINVLMVVDCLDISKSRLARNPVTGRVNRIFEYQFHGNAFADKLLFKLPETSGLEVIVSDRFKEIIETEGLTGLKFDREIFSDPNLNLRHP